MSLDSRKYIWKRDTLPISLCGLRVDVNDWQNASEWGNDGQNSCINSML